MICASVREDNSRALASFFVCLMLYVPVNSFGSTHVHLATLFFLSNLPKRFDIFYQVSFLLAALSPQAFLSE